MPEFIHKGDRKKEYVKDMFNDVSGKYDLLNSILSFGIDSYWRKKLVNKMSINNGSSILDVATGTGNVTFEIAKRYDANIIGLDYAEGMISIAKKKTPKFEPTKTINSETQPAGGKPARWFKNENHN